MSGQPPPRDGSGSQHEITSWFADRADAVRYLRELARLWAVWLVGLAGLLFTNAILLIFWGIAVVIVLVVLVRPLQRRAAVLVPEDEVVAGARGFARGSTVRDRAIRDLSYGEAPLRNALRMAGLSERWLVSRQVMLALTLVAMVYVFATTLPGGTE